MRTLNFHKLCFVAKLWVLEIPLCFRVHFLPALRLADGLLPKKNYARQTFAQGVFAKRITLSIGHLATVLFNKYICRQKFCGQNSVSLVIFHDCKFVKSKNCQISITYVDFLRKWSILTILLELSLLIFVWFGPYWWNLFRRFLLIFLDFKWFEPVDFFLRPFFQLLASFWTHLDIQYKF